MTKSEYAICEYLAVNSGQVFSKERIYEAVYGYDGESDVSTITEHVKNIRAKCKKYGLEPIETVLGIDGRQSKRENVDRYVFKIHRYILHQYRIDIYRRIYRTCTPVNDRSGTSGELCGTMA